MSRAVRKRKEIDQGSQVTVYFNQGIPDQLFNLLNQNLNNTNGIIIEILSAVTEDPDIYRKVAEYVSSQPTGRNYLFPDLIKNEEKHTEDKNETELDKPGIEKDESNAESIKWLSSSKS